MDAHHLEEPLVKFSVDLYKELVAKTRHKENIFFSPFSIFAALYMSLAGARGNTAKQLARVLHANSEDIHDHFSSLLSKLGSLSPGVKLKVANRMYSDLVFPVLDGYLSLLGSSYDATIEAVDFKNDHEKVRAQINAWVEDVTESKIKDLLPGGSLDDTTCLVLINAVYFKGLWDMKFDERFTRRMVFHLDSRKKRSVDMMHRSDDFMMSHSDELKANALELPYLGGKASMIVILPDSYDGLSKLEKRLNAENLLRLSKSLTRRRGIDLYLPKFKLEHSAALRKTLSSLGVKDLFKPSADLTGITASGKLMASEVFHKAFVEVNEEGTEAAAATAVDYVLCCASPEFKVNRPFMFIVRSLDPDCVLFMGSVRVLGTKE
ncbi:hypothetical protein HPB52_023179 [Rhipicephalus sanguineus]|uniref:Serpin domain-containing protein n=2 Tax=Rhipicephalus sanguineus TaxID=34632 RepID=A0A9D4QBF8_RHISA|nr:hypothetical protein HPB52_023179 [Rhipicephalus sanguineus]